MKGLKDKVVIITGAASGIGLAMARKFGAEGSRVVIVDLNLEAAEKAARDVQSSGAADALAVRCDVSQENEAENAVSETMARFGRLDVVVNNAGLMIFKPIQEITASDWHRILGVDLLGAFFFTRAAFREMSNGGAIINISSIHALETTPLVAPYATAKAALVSLTRSAAIEGAPKGIRVNAILPGAVDTPMLWNNPNIKSGAEAVDPTAVGKPEDIADVAAFLASDEARFVQGANVRVDGGRLSRL